MESTTRYGKHCKTNRKSLPWCALANSTSTATVKNSSSSPEKQNRKCSSTTPSANSYHPTPKARNNHKQTASGDGELWTCKQGKAEKHIFGFIPLVVPRKGFSPHIPASRLFILFHPSQAISSTKKKEHSLLVLPLVHTIINFATKFFEMFTKKQPEHPHKLFQVFQVFRANNPRLTKRAQRATNTTTPRCSSWSVCRISRR